MMEDQSSAYGPEDNDGVDPTLWMAFTDYLINVGSPLLGAPPQHWSGHSPSRHNLGSSIVSGFKQALDKSEGIKLVQRFLISGECSVLLVELLQDQSGALLPCHGKY